MVLSELKKTSLVTTGYLVGILHPVKQMLKLLDVSSMEVRIVGIHGMGGIGKTTIAKAVYNEISCHFENCCFLEDVQETSQQHKGLVQLQKQLISNILKLKDVDITSVDEGVNMIKERCCNKKVLIVLDDVNNFNQLRALSNKCDWFGLGSRIIITTRDKHILDKQGVDEVYVPAELCPYQSLKLFCMHAFRSDRPPNDYYGLSSAIAHTVGGLPLALEVLGSHLFGKHKSVWEDALKKLTKIPHHEVQKKLRISYDELDHEQKQIFLDIACFFIGMNKRIATYIWQEYFPCDGIEILVLRSLVKIGNNNELRMHSQLRDLGREIVRSENFDEPGERSRLWFHDDAWEVLKTHTGTQKVQGLRLDFGNGLEEKFLSNEEFAELSRLRLLQIDYAIIGGDFKHLLSKLRWLSWKGCPYNFTPTNFHPEKLIVLDLSWSKVTEDWEGWNQIKMAKKLKVINLSGCCDLIKTPNLSALPYLEGLILEGCKNLVEIDTSIGYLKCLVFLNVKDCKSLVDLPTCICGLEYLESLILSGCTKLSRLPMGSGSLKALKELRIDETSMEQLPNLIALPKKLEILSARNCGFLTVLPTSIGQLRFLTYLALDHARIVMLPDSIGSLLKLRHLSLHGCTSLRKIPDSIGQLESLVELNLENSGVTEIPDLIGHLKSLRNLHLDGTQIIELPNSIGLLIKLEKLTLSLCKSLRKIPDSIGQLKSLVELNLENSGVTEIPDSIGHLKSVEDVQLVETQIVMLPDSIGSLMKLRTLSLGSRCRSLRKIPDSVGQLVSLVWLNLEGARITEIPDSIGSLSMMKSLSLKECGLLRRIPDSIWRLESLCMLNLTETGIIEIPDIIGELKSLKTLELGYTQIIELPESIGSLSMLDTLSLEKCGSLRRIPNSIGRLKSLCKLNLIGTMLTEIPDTVGHLKSLTDFRLDGTQITELPDSIWSLSKLKLLSLSCRLLQRIPDSITKSLHDLKLDITGIMDISNANAMGNHRNLKDLRNGKSGEIPIDVGKLPDSLTSLTLGSEYPFSLPESISSLRLTFLDIRNCKNHPSLPHLPSSLYFLHISGCAMETLQSLSNLTYLSTLSIADCENLLAIPSFSAFPDLLILSISNCKKLQCFPHFPSGLYKLSLSSCMLVESLPDLSSCVEVEILQVTDFFMPTEIKGLERMELLKSLDLSGCRSIEKLPNMSIMKQLQILILINCEKLCNIEGLERLESLEGLNLSGCISLERLPDLSNLKKLMELWISNCKQLIKIQGINEGVHIFGRTTRSRYVKIKSAASVGHLKNEKFTGDRGIKRMRSLETHRRIKRLRSLETLL